MIDLQFQIVFSFISRNLYLPYLSCTGHFIRFYKEWVLKWYHFVKFVKRLFLHMKISLYILVIRKLNKKIKIRNRKRMQRYVFCRKSKNFPMGIYGFWIVCLFRWMARWSRWIKLQPLTKSGYPIFQGFSLTSMNTFTAHTLSMVLRGEKDEENQN